MIAALRISSSEFFQTPPFIIYLISYIYFYKYSNKRNTTINNQICPCSCSLRYVGNSYFFTGWLTESFFFRSKINLRNLLCQVLFKRSKFFSYFIVSCASRSFSLYLLFGILGNPDSFCFVSLCTCFAGSSVFDFYLTISSLIVFLANFYFLPYSSGFFYCFYSFSNDFRLRIDCSELIEGEDFILKQ